MFSRDLISYSVLNNITSQIPWNNIYIKVIIFLYMCYHIVPEKLYINLIENIISRTFGRVNTISFKFDDERRNNLSFRFSALSKYISSQNTDIFKLIEHVNHEWDSNDEVIDRSFYKVNQKQKFLIDEGLQIYGRVQISESEEKDKLGNKKSIKTVTELDVFSEKITVNEIKNWIEMIYLKDKRKMERKYHNNPHLFTIRWDNDKKSTVVNTKKFISNAKFENSWAPFQNTLLKKIKFFLENEKYHQEKGVPYTFGIAMVGPPGGGKTRALKQIINHTKRHGVIIELTDDFDLNVLESIMHGHVNDDICFSPDEMIIIFEDIDVATNLVHNRKDESHSNTKEYKIDRPESHINNDSMMIINSNTLKKPKLQHLGKLLNIIDGVCERHGGMIFLTSNYPDKLDSALIRPGRIDLKIEVNKLTTREIYDFSKHFWGEQFEYKYPQIKQDINGIYSTAELTNIFRSARGKFNNIKDLLISN
uniref:AAA+ ATPase domain-containing protein n=1 Tax=viral metagenome TaxID=1070528 RepID=A0A6C0J6U8_9ZZZZ